MSAPAIIAVIALIASARARLTGVVLGQPVNVPVLLIVAAVLVLALAVLLLWVVRLIARDGLRLRPRMVAP